MGDEGDEGDKEDEGNKGNKKDEWDKGHEAAKRAKGTKGTKGAKEAKDTKGTKGLDAVWICLCHLHDPWCCPLSDNVDCNAGIMEIGKNSLIIPFFFNESVPEREHDEDIVGGQLKSKRQ